MSTDLIIEHNEALVLMTLGIKPKSIQRGTNGIYVHFEKTVDVENILTLYRKNMGFLDAKYHEIRMIESKTRVVITDPFADVGKVFKETTKRIKGAPHKGAAGKYTNHPY